MKTIILLTVTFFLHAVSSFSQINSVLLIKETDFSYYETKNIMNQGTGDIKPVRYLSTADGVTSLVFRAGDSLTLFKDEGTQTPAVISDISEVRKYKFRLGPILTGSAVGILVGGGIGALIGWAATSDVGFMSGIGVVFGAPIGALIGGIIGGSIGSTFNYTTLDMSAVSDKDKKAKLIKFLKQNR